jgi:hypothetical protein
MGNGEPTSSPHRPLPAGILALLKAYPGLQPLHTVARPTFLHVLQPGTCVAETRHAPAVGPAL